MLPVLLAMIAGGTAGFALRRRPGLFAVLEPLTAWVIRLLLFLLGAGIGADETLLADIPVLGLQGLVLAAGAVAGSVAAARVIVGRRFASEDNHNRDRGASTRWKAIRGSLAAVTAFGLGIPIGLLLPIQPILDADPAKITLFGLMLLVGMGAGADSSAAQMLRRHGWRLALLPVAVIVGTLVGTGAAALAWPGLEIRESLAVGAGFGYYSLSSLIIRELSGADWAAVALLSNICRELLTLLLAPVLVRIAGPSAPAAAGGATSMDTTLGVTVQCAGRAWAVPALFSGVILTILTPFGVSLILSF